MTEPLQHFDDGAERRLVEALAMMPHAHAALARYLRVPVEEVADLLAVPEAMSGLERHRIAVALHAAADQTASPSAARALAAAIWADAELRVQEAIGTLIATSRAEGLTMEEAHRRISEFFLREIGPEYIEAGGLG